MNYIFEIIELNKFTNDLRTLYKNYFNKWVEYGGDPLTALHASTISTNEKVISDISKTFKEDIIENFKFFKVLANGEAMPHTDSRNVAINIPIIVDIRNTLSFYEDTGKSVSFTSVLSADGLTLTRTRTFDSEASFNEWRNDSVIRNTSTDIKSYNSDNSITKTSQTGDL